MNMTKSMAVSCAIAVLPGWIAHATANLSSYSIVLIAVS